MRRDLVCRSVHILALCGLALGGSTTWAWPIGGGLEPRARWTDGVLPDTAGAISEILLQFDHDFQEDILPVYDSLFDNLPPDVAVVVVSESRQALLDFMQTFGTSVRSQRRRVSLLDVGLPVSVWARDRIIFRQPVTLRGKSWNYVPAAHWTYDQKKYNELELAQLLEQAHLGPHPDEGRIHLEGGNVVSNMRHVFVGANVFEENEDYFHDPLGLIHEVRILSGREIVFVTAEDGEVPWSHLDMYLTPVGENLVIVGSPQLAADVLGLECVGDFPEPFILESYDEGDARDDEDDSMSEGEGQSPEDGENWLLVDACPTDWEQQHFDGVAKQMRSLGYRVLRLPVLPNHEENWLITYNNVVMDHRPTGRTVFLPVYDVPILDEYAATVYRSLGFRVVPIDVTPVFDLGGAVRCMVNVTERRMGVRTDLELVSGKQSANPRRVSLSSVRVARRPSGRPPHSTDPQVPRAR